MRLSQVSLMILFSMAFLASCSIPPIRLPPSSPQSTVEVEPLYKTIERTNEQFTDGVLSVSIRQADDTCHSISEPISLKLTFENLSDKPLVLLSSFSVSQKRFGADNGIFVWMDTKDGTPLLSPHDLIIEESLGATPAPPKYQILNEHSKLEITLSYVLPTQLINGDVQNNHNIFTPGPGQYLIRFVYQNLVSSQLNEWTGVIASNRLEICVIE